MPFSFDQYQAARQSVAILDRSSRGRIVLRGRDRLTFLHALVTNDVATLPVGTGCYAAMLTAQGRMFADMLVFELGDVTLLDVHGGVKDALLAKLDDMHFSEDVEIGDVTATFGSLGVHGPRSTALLAATLGVEQTWLEGWKPCQNVRADWAGETIIAARLDEFGLQGFVLFAAMASMPTLAAALGANGAEVLEPDTADVLRVEAGEPQFLVDMGDDTIPFEAGIEGRAVSFTKGCFPGQEVLVRIRDRGRGRIARKLVGLVVDGDVVPRRGDVVRGGDTDLGLVTSAVWSPGLGRPIALGYVLRDFFEPGTRLTIVSDDATLNATVAGLPFVP
jgi:folate-binding protein YgfZ